MSLPKSTLYNFIALILGVFTLIISALIHIAVPGSPVPVSMQSLAVLLVAFLVPYPYGIITILSYLFLGILGFPVFADGNHGIQTITGKTGGYLIGFLLCTIWINYQRNLKRNFTFPGTLFTAAAGTLIILLSGYIQLGFQIGYPIALEKGILPFIPGAILKILMAALIVYYLRKSVWIK